MPAKGSPPQGGGELRVSAEKLGLESTFVPEDHVTVHIYTSKRYVMSTGVF